MDQLYTCNSSDFIATGSQPAPKSVVYLFLLVTHSAHTHSVLPHNTTEQMGL